MYTKKPKFQLFKLKIVLMKFIVQNKKKYAHITLFFIKLLNKKNLCNNVINVRKRIERV